MIKLMKSSLHLITTFILIAFTLAIVTVAQDSRAKMDIELHGFEKALVAALKEPLHAGLDETGVFSAKRNFESDDTDSLESISLQLNCGIDLWIADQREYLLLNWHRTNSRQKRLLIVSLFICERIERLRDPLDGSIDFEKFPVRYKDREETERLEELSYVKKHARAIAKQLHAAMRKIVPDHKLAGFAYTAALTDEDYAALLKEADRSLEKKPDK
jgi:hypothetical protein